MQAPDAARKTRLDSARIAFLTIATLTLASYTHEILSKFHFYKGLHRSYPFYVAETLDKLLGVLLCCAALYLVHRIGLRKMARELSLAAPVLPAFGFALLASSPTLIGFALTRRLAPRLSAPALFFLTAFSPFVEELEFRGYAFWQLARRAHWPVWAAVLPPAVLFALGHMEKGQNLKEMIGIFVLTGTGSAVFSWLLWKWVNLWVPIALHLCMNLWWEIFSVARTSLGGWFPFTLQTLTILLAILLTLRQKRRRPEGAGPAAS